MRSNNHDLLVVLKNLITGADEEFLMQICSAQNTIETLIECINSGLEEESKSALEAIGEILACAENEVVDFFIFHNGVPAIFEMIKNGQNLKQGFWCLSNIAAGTDSHKQSILLAEGLPEIFSHMRDEHPNDLRKEACMVVTNFVTTT